MIANTRDYEIAQAEIRELDARLARLQQAHRIGSKGFTKAGSRTLIARLHEELAVFEGRAKARPFVDPPNIQ